MLFIVSYKVGNIDFNPPSHNNIKPFDIELLVAAYRTLLTTINVCGIDLLMDLCYTAAHATSARTN